jgi:colanic acid biosynthesis glycosyl transferase WcaI
VAKAAAAGGLVVAPGDTAAFGAAIHALLSDAARRAALGRAGRDYAMAYWDRDAVLRTMLAELEASLAKTALPQPVAVRVIKPAVAQSTIRE